MSQVGTRPISRMGLLLREVLPDPGGILSFGLMVLILAAHLLVSPDPWGGIFGTVLDWFPQVLRGPFFDVCFEGFAQAFLLVGPVICLYAGLRHLFMQGDSLLPYITVAGGGFLSVLTGASLLYTFVGRFLS